MASESSIGGQEAAALAALLSHLSSGGPVVSSLEPRLARVELGVERAQTDIQELKVQIKELRAEFKSELTCMRTELSSRMDNHFYILLGFMVAMLGVMAKGFGWV